MSDIKKRFVAGAVCPKCALMDVVVVYSIEDHEYRECIECGFSDRIKFKSELSEITTRVNKTEEQIKEETQVVTIQPSTHPTKNKK